MRYLRSLAEKRIDGIVVNSIAPLDSNDRKELAEFGVPIVLLNRVAGSAGFSTVCADNEEGGRLAGKYLASLGHKKIAHLTGQNLRGNLSDRARGFLKAVESAGLAEPILLRGEHSQKGGYELACRLIEREPKVTAIFAANDAMAFGALRALIEMEKRVPDDVSLIGFDNVEMSAITHPPLTTIHQPKYEIGRAAVEMLLARRDPPQMPEHRTLGVQLIERQSCRKL
jgi:LacI family transcriptional regulator